LEDPARFIHEALRAIEVFRTSLKTHQPPTAFIGNEADEACLLDNIEEALTGILNAIMHSDTNSILLNEQYLTQLGSLLNVKYFLKGYLIN